MGAEVSPSRAAGRDAEVGGLVPAVPGGGQRVDDGFEVTLHGLGLPLELVPVRAREPRSGLGLELVVREVLGLEGERVGEIGAEFGGALAGDPVHEIEGDVVQSGITEKVHRAPDVIGLRPSLQHLQKMRLEALSTERNSIHAALDEQARQLGRHRLRIRLHGELVRVGKPCEEPGQLLGRCERGCAAPEKHRLETVRQNAPLERELGEQRVHVPAVLRLAPDDGDEVAIATAIRAERQVHVEVSDSAHRFRSVSRFRTARKASCGTSTPPTCFILFLPFFCFSSSFRFREMSPP